MAEKKKTITYVALTEPTACPGISVGEKSLDTKNKQKDMTIEKHPDIPGALIMKRNHVSKIGVLAAHQIKGWTEE